MKRKWTIFLLVAAFLLGVIPLKTEAKTSVSVGIGIGSAVAVGGGLIYWGVSASQRVGVLPGDETRSGLTFAPIVSPGSGSISSFDRFFLTNLDDPRELMIEMPVLQYRW